MVSTVLSSGDVQLLAQHEAIYSTTLQSFFILSRTLRMNRNGLDLEFQTPSVPSNAQGRDVAISGRYLLQGPVRCFATIGTGRKQRIPISRSQRDVKLVKRKRQAGSLCLDIGFLSGPAAEKTCISLCRRKRGKLTLFLH